MNTEQGETITVSMPKEQYNWLCELSKLIKTQDNRSTADPIFYVIDVHEVIIEGDYSPMSYFGDVETRYVYVDPENSDNGAIEYDDVDQWCEDNNLEKDDLTLLRVAEMPYVVNAHLTDAGARLYIQQNRHNLKKPSTWAGSMYGCWDMIELRNFIQNFSKIAVLK